MSLYELSTVSAEEFAQDPYVAVPFFQRKSTWTGRVRQVGVTPQRHP